MTIRYVPQKREVTCDLCEKVTGDLAPRLMLSQLTIRRESLDFNNQPDGKFYVEMDLCDKCVLRVEDKLDELKRELKNED